MSQSIKITHAYTFAYICEELWNIFMINIVQNFLSPSLSASSSFIFLMYSKSMSGLGSFGSWMVASSNSHPAKVKRKGKKGSSPSACISGSPWNVDRTLLERSGIKRCLESSLKLANPRVDRFRYLLLLQLFFARFSAVFFLLYDFSFVFPLPSLGHP